MEIERIRMLLCCPEPWLIFHSVHVSQESLSQVAYLHSHRSDSSGFIHPHLVCGHQHSTSQASLGLSLKPDHAFLYMYVGFRAFEDNFVNNSLAFLAQGNFSPRFLPTQKVTQLRWSESGSSRSSRSYH